MPTRSAPASPNWTPRPPSSSDVSSYCSERLVASLGKAAASVVAAFSAAELVGSEEGDEDEDAVDNIEARCEETIAGAKMAKLDRRPLPCQAGPAPTRSRRRSSGPSAYRSRTTRRAPPPRASSRRMRGTFSQAAPWPVPGPGARQRRRCRPQRAPERRLPALETPAGRSARRRSGRNARCRDRDDDHTSARRAFRFLARILLRRLELLRARTALDRDGHRNPLCAWKIIPRLSEQFRRSKNGGQSPIFRKSLPRRRHAPSPDCPLKQTKL